MKRLLVTLIFLVLMSGCSATEFTARTTTALESLASKSWRTSVFLEPDIYNPATYLGTGGNRTFNGFDVTLSGSRAYIALSLYDPSTLRFEGFVRTYQDGTGWLTGSAGFQKVANSSTAFGFGAPWITSSADGRAAAGFWAATSAAGVSLAVARRGSRWGRAQTTALTDLGAVGLSCQVGWGTTNGSIFDLDWSLGHGPGSSAYLSPQGRLYLFYANAGTRELKLEVIDPASAADDNVDYSNLETTFQGTELRHVMSLDDGQNRLCYFLESEVTLVRKLVSRCLDLSAGGVSLSPDPVTESANEVTTDSTKGFSAGTDRAGKIITVQYENTASGYEPTYSVFSEGSWEVVSGEIDPANVDLDTPADATVYGEAYPVIAHLGDEFWFAAWVRIDTSDNTENLYISYYDAENDEWFSTTSLVELEYENRSRVESLTLASNHSGDLVLAARFVSVEDTAGGSGTWDDRRRTLVYRYNSQLGWLSGQIVGQGCLPAVTQRLGECTQPAQAVILPSGNALVVFPDQDPSGLTRPAASEFR
jgi:hypothetical protein